MLIKEILVPHAVADICYLSEALMWVAFNRFPLGTPVAASWDDVRRDMDHILGLDPSVDIEDPTDTECASVGLSPRPDPDDVTGAAVFGPESLKESLASCDVEDPIRPNLEKALAESIAFRENLTKWNEEINHFLDLHRAQLFMALRRGKLVAEGIKLPERTYEASLVRLNETGWKGWSPNEWVTIPSDFWNSEKINWKKCWAEGRDAAFALIQIETEELFACFPPPAPQVANVVRVANDVVAVDQTGDETKARKRGRPPFDWDSFHVEVAMRIYSEDGLPDKQDALIADMETWCQRTWHRDVGRSTLQQKIKPYYDALARRGS